MKILPQSNVFGPLSRWADGRAMAVLAPIFQTSAVRTFLLGAGTIVLWALSYHLALAIRFEHIPPAYLASTPAVLALFVPVKLLWHAVFKVYRVSWRLVGLIEVMGVAKASALASLTLAGALYLLQQVPAYGTFPRSVLLLDYLLSSAFIASLLLARRMLDEMRVPGAGKGEGTRALLVGAGAAGEQIVRAMRNGGRARYHPVGFIDDDRSKHGLQVYGLKVLGGRDVIPSAIRAFSVEEVLIVIPSAVPESIREIVRYAREAGVRRIRMLPSITELVSNQVSLQDIRPVRLDDLLGRPPVSLDRTRVHALLHGRTVLVTGAGGSIGSELVRQLSRTPAARLLLLDTNETALFDLEGELADRKVDPQLHTIVADIRDAGKMQRLFSLWKPDVVYHAAAYKHVPMMEGQPDEAVATNVFGTLLVAEAALASGTHTFVLISTDKAVHPVSIMGATKRVAELLVKALNARGVTRFMAVRFGNVIGSRGSVIPLMKEQIRRGGPVTITDPAMERYFMTSREAVTLVLHASAMAHPHDILTLDMGQPIKILELAHELIRLSGFEPDGDIPIVFTGVRPGEKMHEILETPDEPLEPTEVPKVFAVTTSGRIDEITLRVVLRELDRLGRSGDLVGVKNLLRHLTGGAADRSVTLAVTP